MNNANSARFDVLRLKEFLANNIVQLLFGVVIVSGLVVSDQQPVFMLNEIIQLCIRNAVLVLALLIPVMAGMGLNFSIAIGAMAGQFAVIMAVNWGLEGFTGFITTMLIATLIALVFGFVSGKILSKTKGYEMIASLFLVYFSNGIYQAICLSAAGRVIPIKDELLLGNGVGLRNTIDLKGTIGSSLDGVLGGSLPLMTILLTGLVALLILFISRTKFGEALNRISSEGKNGRQSGLSVDNYKVAAIMLSIVIASWGQLISLQSISILNTYGSHMQAVMLPVFTLVVGGATIHKASMRHVFLGLLLLYGFNTVFPDLWNSLVGEGNMQEVIRLMIFNGVVLYAFVRMKSEGSETVNNMKS